MNSPRWFLKYIGRYSKRGNRIYSLASEFGVDPFVVRDLVVSLEKEIFVFARQLLLEARRKAEEELATRAKYEPPMNQTVSGSRLAQPPTYR